MSILSSYIFLLLFIETTLSRQTRTIGYIVCVRILPSTISYQKLVDNTQKPSASWFQWHAKALIENIGNKKCTWTTSWSATSSATSIRFCCWIGPAAARPKFQREAPSLGSVHRSIFILKMRSLHNIITKNTVYLIDGVQ